MQSQAALFLSDRSSPHHHRTTPPHTPNSCMELIAPLFTAHLQEVPGDWMVTSRSVPVTGVTEPTSKLAYAAAFLSVHCTFFGTQAPKNRRG